LLDATPNQAHRSAAIGGFSNPAGFPAHTREDNGGGISGMNVGACERGIDRRQGSGGDDLVMSEAGGEPARILVVDNDPVTNRLIVDYLENRNMRAIPASGRHEMARLLTIREPSLVLLDLGPGRDNGLDLLREIRS
jgi:hypothetical protein